MTEDYRLRAVRHLGEFARGGGPLVYSYKVVRGMHDLGIINSTEAVNLYRFTHPPSVWRWTRSAHSARSILRRVQP